MIIVDSSGSMNKPDADASGTTRARAAAAAVTHFVQSLPAGSQIGLVTYGDQTPEDLPREAGCSDVSVKVPLGSDPAQIAPAMDALRPTGWTPIGLALQQAAEASGGEPLQVVLVSDGEDSCAPPDPCEAAAQLVQHDPQLTISAIGLRESSEQLSCIADKGRGAFVSANNSAQLAKRLVAIRDPQAAAERLAPEGVQGIGVGMGVAELRDRYPDFPEVGSEGQVQVVWRNCTWLFNQGVLVGIELAGGQTIDDLVVGGEESSLEILGPPIATEPSTGGEVRYYVADEQRGLAWWIEVKDGRIVRIVLCRCLPTSSCVTAPEAIRIEGDRSMQISSINCTSDAQWAVVASTFESGATGGWLLLQRSDNGWVKARRITHQSDCYAVPAQAPLAEVDKLIEGFCAYPFPVVQVRGAPITTDGIGALRIGAGVESLISQNLVERFDMCGGYRLVPGLGEGNRRLWAEFDGQTLVALGTPDPEYRTLSGAHVGMSLDQLNRIYPGGLERRVIDGEGGPRTSLVFRSGEKMIEFVVETSGAAPQNRVEGIYVSRVDRPFVGGC